MGEWMAPDPSETSVQVSVDRLAGVVEDELNDCEL
jgi:hypothetical protein